MSLMIAKISPLLASSRAEYVVFRLENVEQLHIKIQGGTTWNDATSTTVTVSQARWDDNLAAFTNCVMGWVCCDAIETPR